MAIFNSGLLGEGLPDVVSYEDAAQDFAAQLEAELGALSVDAALFA